MLTFNEYVTEATKGPSIKQSVIDAYKKATGGHTSAVYHNKGKDGSSTVKVDEPHLKPEEMEVFHDHLKSIHGDTYIKTENRASKKTVPDTKQAYSDEKIVVHFKK